MCFSSILFMAPDVEQLRNAVQHTSEVSSWLGMVLAILFFVVAYHHRAVYRIQPLWLVVGLLACNFLFHLSLQMCKAFTSHPETHWLNLSFPIYWGQFFFRLSSRYITLAIVAHYWLIARGGYRSIAPVPLCSLLVTVLGLVAIELGSGMAVNITTRHNSTVGHVAPFAANYAISCWFRERFQVWYALVIDLLIAMAHCAILMLVARLD